ncbi:hypothetical protein F4808DRAFT_413389 [Astrocystis sublimbata]|nr:hypothetical protein F4808DRAFT_413389 [Astrocystis sublimbata]
MTYERQDPLPRRVELERLHGSYRHLRLSHEDIFNRNIMIGDHDPLVPEHRATPKLALIDFGLARELRPRQEREAERRNLDAISQVILHLINPPLSLNARVVRPYEWNGMRTMGAGLFDERRTSLLDPELRTLLAESLRIGVNGEPLGRPSLRETYERTRQGMLKPAESYQARVRESDDYIRVRLQRFILDANQEW